MSQKKFRKIIYMAWYYIIAQLLLTYVFPQTAAISLNLSTVWIKRMNATKCVYDARRDQNDAMRMSNQNGSAVSDSGWPRYQIHDGKRPESRKIWNENVQY